MDLRRELSEALARGDLRPVRAGLRGRDASAVFHALFPIAVDQREDGADQAAGRLLVDIEPDCPVTCEAALLTVAHGEWFISDRCVPIYLITQFGKKEVGRTANELLATAGLTGPQSVAVSGVAYWAGFPLAELMASVLSRQPDLFHRDVSNTR